MPNNPRYNPPEGYKPPKEAGKKSDIGVGNRAAPQREGESDADFKKRQAQWMKSYMARGGVKLKDMNQGQLNKYVASGGAHRAEAVGANLGRFIGKPDSNPASNNNNTPERDKNKEPKDEAPGRNQGMTARGGSAQSTGGFGGSIGSMGAAAGLSRMPGQGRRAQRRAAQIARRRSMVGGR